MKAHRNSFAANDKGSVSVVLAAAILPLFLAMALTVDVGAAWISKTDARIGAEAAASIASLHKSPSCTSGAIDAATLTEAKAAYAAATGKNASLLEVDCTSLGVAAKVRVQSPLSVFSLLGRDTVEVSGAAGRVTQINGKGWVRA